MTKTKNRFQESSTIDSNKKLKRKMKIGLQDHKIKGILKSKTSNETEFEEINELDINISENEEESSGQDNTPKSLKKKSKKLKKKNKLNKSEDNNKSVEACINYLNTWKNDKSSWKFEKVKQIRLISNTFDIEKVPEKTFPIFVEYMIGASDSTKKVLLSKANEVVSEMEKWCSLSEEEKSSTEKVDENKYERARTLLQFLE